ncbi:MAG: hypothetical protein M3032_07035 [Verrucomicrobiota bacterium]|nr:hypothetical protein [Verrucomicrobiota bacterium]
MDAQASFDALTTYATVVTVAFLGALFFLIAYRLLTGQINTRGLLADKVGGGISPARVQLMALSLSGAFYYLMSVVEMVQSGPRPNLTLPAPSTELLALVLGSNTVYVTAKATSSARVLAHIRSFFR